MTWCEDIPPPPWWKRLLWKVFPSLRPKYEFKTIETLRFNQPNANNDVYSQESIKDILLKDSMVKACVESYKVEREIMLGEEKITDMCLRDSTFSGAFTNAIFPVVTKKKGEKN